MSGDDPWRIGLVAVLVIAGGLCSFAHGLPSELPAASLGWPVLLHLERSIALLGLVAISLLVGVRATKGTFPTKFGQVEYPADGVDRREDAVMSGYEVRLEAMEQMLGALRRDGRERI